MKVHHILRCLFPDVLVSFDRLTLPVYLICFSLLPICLPFLGYLFGFILQSTKTKNSLLITYFLSRKTKISTITNLIVLHYQEYVCLTTLVILPLSWLNSHDS